MRFEILVAEAAEASWSGAGAGPFERPAWVRAVALARGRAHRFVQVRACRQGTVIARMYGAVHRRFGLPLFEAMPMAGYAQWIAPGPLEEEARRDLTSEWLRAAPWPVVALTCRPGGIAALPRPRLGSLERHFVTHVLPLADEASMLASAQPRFRSYLRKFGNAGFSFEVGRGEDFIARFYDWYRAGSRHWQSAPGALLPRAFFLALLADAEADVWIVRQHGREAGAAVFLRGSDEVHYQASGTSRVEGPVSAMEAILWSAARYYRERGASVMNLGASEGLDSVRRFKEKFGARPMDYLRAFYVLPRFIPTFRPAAERAPC